MYANSNMLNEGVENNVGKHLVFIKSSNFEDGYTDRICRTCGSEHYSIKEASECCSYIE